MDRRALFLFILAFSIPLLHSFSAQDYLYPGEDAGTIKQVKFTAEGKNYELISYGGVETFLLEDGSPLNDTSRISQALKKYESTSVYPTKAELEDVRSAFLAFNATRNLNTTPRGKTGAEDSCEQYLSLKVRPCTDYQSCYLTTTVTCNRLGLECTNIFYTLLNYTTDFAMAGNGLDEEIGKADRSLQNSTFETIHQSLTDISASVPKMRDYANRIKNSKLRYDRTCGECLAMCVIIPIDMPLLDTAETKLNTLRSKVAVIGSINQTALQISNFTQTRLQAKVNAALSGSYGKTFAEMQKNARGTIDSASNAQKYVYDPEFAKDVSELNTLTLDITASISQNRFFGLNAQFERYNALSSKLNSTMKNYTEPYDKVVEIRENISDDLIKAEWITDRGNLEEVTAYNALKVRKYNLDRSITPPMSIQSYRFLYYNYSQLYNDTKDYTASHVSATNTLYWLVGNIGKASVDGVLKLSSPFVTVNYKTRQAYSSIIPPILLILTDFSLISLSLVLFAALIVRMKKYFIKRIVLLAWAGAILVFILVIAIGSLGFYAILNQASDSATYSEFNRELSKSNTSVVIIDATNATAGANLALSSCASRVRNSLFARNISSSLLTMDDEKCYVGSNTTSISRESCYNRIGDVPVFTLAYSSKNKTPVFSVVYTKEVLIAGDAQYLQKCDLANVLD